MLHSFLNRSTPLRKQRKGNKPRPGRVKGKDMAALRQACFDRDRGLCQKCGHMVNPALGPEYAESFHLAHRKAKRRNGDSLDNVEVNCGACHKLSHQYGPSMVKPVPRKEAE